VKDDARTLRALIVDDEPLARASLRSVLEALDRVEIVGEACDGESALEAVVEGVDVIFLDIRMPGLNGLAFGRAMNTMPRVERPHVVFVTAYEEHAVRAFELEATDYVTKPVDPERLRAAVERVLRHQRLRAALRVDEEDEPVEGDGGPEDDPSGHAERIMVRDGDRIHFVPVGEISLFEADGNYVRVHTDDREHLVRLTLKSVAARLDPRRFVRVHRSYVVNVDRIQEVQPWFGGDYVALMGDGREIRISRTYKDNLLRAFL
jgi:two-component system LytT family response regulator